MSVPAVFADRDGTVIEDRDYLADPAGVALIPGAVEGLRAAAAKGYALYVVSNQSGVGRGLISPERFEAVHQVFAESLSRAGVSIAGYLYCFHRPDENCACRKPRIGLVPASQEGHALDLAKSFTVGDKICDLELGDNLGARGCLVLTGKGKVTLVELESAGRAGAYPAYADLAAFAGDLPVTQVPASPRR